MFDRVIDKIKKLFNKNKSNEVRVITLDNLITLPTRNDLKEDKISIEKIDKYKDDYLVILANKQTITSHKLGEYNGISDSIKMYTDIYSRIILDEEELFEYQIANKTELVLRKLDIKNKLLKINLYLNDLSNLEKEIILHLISLKEIKREKVFFSPLRKRTLEEEINTLIMSLININSQKRAIEIETNTSLKNHELLNILNEEVNDEEQELIDIYYDGLKRIMKRLNIWKDINTDNRLMSISKMEKNIEVYTYKNKINIDKLMIDIIKDEIKKLKNKISKISNLDYYKILIKYYEERYKKYYKKGFITEEDMLSLYELKFYIITSNINDNEEIKISDNSSAFEFEYYKKIMENILRIIMEYHTDNKEDFEYYFKDTLLKKILKGKYNNKIDYSKIKYYEILNDKELLGFILGIYKTLGGFTGSKNTLENFFGSLPVKEEEIIETSPFGVNEIKFNEEAKKTRMTIYFLNNLRAKYGLSLSEEKIIENDNLYFFGYITFEHLLSKSLLEIVKIDNNSKLSKNRGILFDEFTQLVDKIDNIYDLILPESLKKVEDRLFYKENYRRVILNEGLKSLDIRTSYSRINIEELTIPSTLEHISSDLVLDCYGIKKLIINNADKLALDKLSIELILLKFFGYKIVDDNWSRLVLKCENITFKFGNKEVIIYPDDIDFNIRNYFDQSKTFYGHGSPLLYILNIVDIKFYLSNLIIKKLNEKEEDSVKVRVLK